MKKLIFLLSLLCLSNAFPNDIKKLSLWIHPYLPAAELHKRFDPLVEYLSKKLNIPISIHVQSSYKAHVDFVGEDHADIAYLGPASYVQVRKRYGEKPILAKLEVNGSPFFHGMVIAREDSQIKTLKDLKGKSVAFGDLNSTMSHIVPRAMIEEAGVPINQLSRHDHLKSHHDVALAVLGGYFDAGGVKEEVFYEFQSQGIKMLAKSPPIPEHLFVTRSNLPEELIKKIRSIMLAINDDKNNEQILKSLKGSVSGLVSAKDSDYKVLRELIK